MRPPVPHFEIDAMLGERNVSEPNDPTIEERKVAEIKQLISEKRFDERLTGRSR